MKLVTHTVVEQWKFNYCEELLSISCEFKPVVIGQYDLDLLTITYTGAGCFLILEDMFAVHLIF